MPILLALAWLLSLHWLARDWVPRERRGREPFIDVAKGLAIVGVVGIHVAELFPSTRWIKDWLGAALAIFVLCSGFVLHLDRDGPFDMRAFYGKMLVRLVTPYLLLSLVFLAAAGVPLAEFPASLLFGRANGNYYFIPLLLGLYVLYPLLRLAGRQLAHPLALAAAYLFSLYFSRLHHELSRVQWNANEWSLIFFGRFFFFFVLGMFLSRFDLTRIPRGALALLLGLYTAEVAGLAVVYGWLDPLLLYPVAVLLLLLLAYRASPATWGVCLALGPHTLLIYLLHTKFVFSFGGPRLAHALRHLPWLGFLVVVLFATAAAYGLARVLTAITQRLLAPAVAQASGPR
jgi:peptidoglycan/LPS O-acetylase OafA/YrhL